MIIKKANAYDASNIARVHHDEWNKFYKNYVSESFAKKITVEARKKFWIRYISDGGVVYVIEEKMGELVGFIVPKLISKSYGVNEGEIMAHYVTRGYQSHGYGKALLVAAAKFFLKNKAQDMHVWVHRENPSVYFYVNNGGKEVDVKMEKLDSKNIIRLKYKFDDLEELIQKNEDSLQGFIKEL